MAGSNAENGMGTAALVLGIVGIVLMCAYGIGLIPSVLAIIFGKIGMTKADQGVANNRGSAKAGFILGIVGIALALIGLLVVIVLFVVAANAPSTSTIPSTRF